jgi:hypothetical protein
MVIGAAIILDGHVQVMSCSKNVAYKEGKMQAVYDYQPSQVVTTPIKPSPKQFIAKPYTMDFDLRKTGGNY